MSTKFSMPEEFGPKVACSACPRPKRLAEIMMREYADNYENIFLCRDCALQLSRKLLEDLCELAGDRHG